MSNLIELENLLMKAIAEFNEKAKRDEKLRKALTGITRKVLIQLEEGKSFKFVLQNNQITDFEEGKLEKPDVLVTSDLETLEKLIKKELKPFKAYATGKIKLKASLMDLLRLREFFTARG